MAKIPAKIGEMAVALIYLRWFRTWNQVKDAAHGDQEEVTVDDG